MGLKDERCIGCFSYQTADSLLKCHIPFRFIDKQSSSIVIECPCLKCVVKGICETICSDYKKYVKVYFINKELE